MECELGAISGVEDGISHKNVNLVDLQEVEQFIAVVDCDALAVGIGNAHGMYQGTPNLDFDRLAACRALGTPPLVLHGGSGTPDDMIRKAISDFLITWVPVISMACTGRQRQICTSWPGKRSACFRANKRDIKVQKTGGLYPCFLRNAQK